MQPSVFLTGALYAALAASQTEAHGYISQPLAKFVPNVVYTTYNGIITADSYPAFAGKQFARSPEQNAQVFTECFKASEFKTLKAMLDPAVSNCGNTRTDVDPVDVTSMQTMNWQNNEYKQGFLDSHHGPCEVWIDDTRVFQDDDCRADYTAFPAALPVDYSVCTGTCRLTFYWLAVHSPQWQIYKQCVPIVYKGSSHTTTSTTTSTNSSATVEAEADDSGSDEGFSFDCQKRRRTAAAN